MSRLILQTVFLWKSFPKFLTRKIFKCDHFLIITHQIRKYYFRCCCEGLEESTINNHFGMNKKCAYN